MSDLEPCPKKKIDYEKVKSLVTELLAALGEDPQREGLVETPRRIANFWREFIEYDAGKLDTTFSAVKHNQMVAVTGMKVWSMCEQLVSDIANHLKDILGTDDVAVMAKGEHLCMTMRGIKTPHRMISSALSGKFHQPEQRAEFLRLVGND